MYIIKLMELIGFSSEIIIYNNTILLKRKEIKYKYYIDDDTIIEKYIHIRGFNHFTNGKTYLENKYKFEIRKVKIEKLLK